MTTQQMTAISLLVLEAHALACVTFTCSTPQLVPFLLALLDFIHNHQMNDKIQRRNVMSITEIL